MKADLAIDVRRPPVRKDGLDVGAKLGALAQARLTAGPRLLWTARMLWLGQRAPDGMRTASADSVWIGLDAPLKLSFADAPHTTFCRRVVHVPAGREHQLSFEGRALACLFSDPQTGDRSALGVAAQIEARGAALTPPHAFRSIDVLLDVILNPDDPDTEKRCLEQALGLRSLPAENDLIGRCVQALNGACEPWPSVEDLAAASGLSPSSFRRGFRQYAGVTLKRYRVWRRLGSALQLATTGASLTDAAHESGFSSSAHLSSACRNLLGLTPSEMLVRRIAERSRDPRAKT